jgi:hypothetical protein
MYPSSEMVIAATTLAVALLLVVTIQIDIQIDPASETHRRRAGGRSR